MMDVWIVTPAATWDALDPAGQSYESVYRSAVTGYWSQSVYNALGGQEAIQDLLDALGNPPAYAWTQGQGTDSLDIWPTDPTAILALMQPHVTYNEDGSVASTTPATFENPNWGHMYFGQRQRIFAGAFSSGFSEGFR